MESMLDRPEQELVLVVDDTPDNLLLMRELLEEQYRVRTAGSGPAGLRAAVEEPRPDLILLDVNMPGMDGYEVCRRLKADPLTRDIPLMFLTARADRDDEQQGLALGAVDYLGKPVSPPIVLARVRTHLQLKANADFLRDKSEYLELEVRRRTRQLQQLQDAVIEALATLGDLRDNPRSRHLPRIERYVRLLAEHLAAQRAFADELTPEAVDLLSKSALLHDIGKVAVPDRVLLNPGATGRRRHRPATGPYPRRARRPGQRRAAARPAFRIPPLRPADRLQSSRTLGWPGLSGRPCGRADSPGGADRRPGRPLR